MALTCTKCGGTIADIGGHIGVCIDNATGFKYVTNVPSERRGSKQASSSPSETQLTLRDYWREKLSGGTLDELFEEAKTCGHEGSCWDLINILADILVPHTEALFTQALTSVKSEMEKKKKEPYDNLITVNGEDYIVESESFNHAISECQRVVELAIDKQDVRK